MIEVVERSRRGGSNGGAGVPPGGAPGCLELETSGRRWLVEVVNGDARRGTLRVGADHVVLDEQGSPRATCRSLLRIRPVNE
ncbi:MAG: hypothetical protein U0W40_20590 [Acidimicrobiia bacterium]